MITFDPNVLVGKTIERVKFIPDSRDQYSDLALWFSDGSLSQINAGKDGTLLCVTEIPDGVDRIDVYP